MSKITLHIPTEQYGFVAVEVDPLEQSTEPETIVEIYKQYSDAFKGGEGMLDAELDIWVYNMLLGKGNDADIYQKATPAQQKELHRIKRALARIKRNQDNLDID